MGIVANKGQLAGLITANGNKFASAPSSLMVPAVSFGQFSSVLPLAMCHNQLSFGRSEEIWPRHQQRTVKTRSALAPCTLLMWLLKVERESEPVPSPGGQSAATLAGTGRHDHHWRINCLCCASCPCKVVTVYSSINMSSIEQHFCHSVGSLLSCARPASDSFSKSASAKYCKISSAFLHTHRHVTHILQAALMKNAPTAGDALWLWLPAMTTMLSLPAASPVNGHSSILEGNACFQACLPFISLRSSAYRTGRTL